jgi:hypothetical protein
MLSNLVISIILISAFTKASSYLGVGYKDYFRLELGPIDGAVAVDLDERFAEWKLGRVESVAIERGKCGSCWMCWLCIGS